LRPAFLKFSLDSEATQIGGSKILEPSHARYSFQKYETWMGLRLEQDFQLQAATE
jgi:hypothetical protein